MQEKQIYNAGYRALIAKFKARRKQLGLSQAEVARKLGVQRSWIGKIEQCELKLTLLGFVKLCGVLGLDPRKMIRMLEE